MASKIHPSTYKDALEMIDTVKLDQLALEPWVAHFDLLEARLTKLEKALTQRTQKKIVANKTTP